MKIKLGRIMGALLIVAVGGYFAVQLYNFSKPDVKTETAVTDTAYDKIDVYGCVIREESPITYSGSGVLSVAVTDGERVPVGGVVAKVYQSEEDLDRELQIRELSAKIDMLEECGEDTGGNLSEVTELDRKIEDLCKEISGLASDGQTAKVYDDTLAMSGLIGRKQIITGTMTDYASNLTALKKKLSELKRSVAAPVSTITTGKAGYFVLSSDGLEGKFTPLMLDSVKPEDITADKLLPVADGGSGKTAFGKLVSAYKWYFVSDVTEKNAKLLADEKNVSLRFPFAMDTTVPAKVESIVAQKDGTSMVTLSSDTMFGEINYIRGQNAQIVLNTYKGIRVDKRAIKMLDGVTGVFVLNGSVMRFRPINILFYDDSYVIVEYDEAASKAISLYDEIVVGGKDLYDGKLVMQ